MMAYKTMFHVACIAMLTAECACSQGPTSAGNKETTADSGANSAASDAAIDGSQPDAEGGSTTYVGEDGGVIGLEVAPLTLVPPFSPSIFDYYVRCAAGDNPVTITVRGDSGSYTLSVDLEEDHAAVVAGQYWIRCLAHDFPAITVEAHPDAGAPTPGLYLVNSGSFVAVFDTNGTPVWYERGTMVLNLDAPAVNTLSFMTGATAPFGTSLASQFVVYALDQGTKTPFTAVNGPTDAHEFQSLPNGDRLLFTYPIETGVDLTGLGTYSAGQSIADCMVQEVDAQGNLVWSWLATDHVDPVKESVEPAGDPVNGVTVIDVFHCNSIDVDSSGNLLVSMRQANAIFYIERSTGKVLWKLNGTAYNKDGAALVAIMGDPQTQFTEQHDARFRPNGNVSLFDDHTTGGGVARGVEYAIDHTSGTATVAWQFLGIGASRYEGSFRRYDDGASVIGWGYVANDPRVVTEVNASGQDVLDIALPGMQQSYRAVKVSPSQLDLNVLRKTAAQ
jgi:Arylsulfotransferase (ASST)